MRPDFNIHKNVLVNILKDIFTDPDISPYLGFKGGTAAMLFYELPRFSVDLDFDLLDKTKEDIVFEEVKSILENYGSVKFRNKRYSLFFLLTYKGKISGAQNIKIEINKRDFGSKYEVKHYLGIPMQVMVKEDMFAHKLVAMYERIGTTNRDIYDVWFFLKNNWSIKKEIVELRTNISFTDFLQKCISELEKMSNRNVLSGIGELLNEKQKAWVKSNLKNDTVFFLKLKLDSIKS